MAIKNILNQFFGYTDFKSGQLEIISTILNGKNVLAILPTGGGKSICYQIPALLSPSFSIVISPLIALMKDQVDAINKRDTIAAFINSSLDYREAEKVIQNVALGKIKLLYLSPEKLDSIQFVEKLKSLNPHFLFVDEAHCISEWGHNFRPSYRKIKQFIEYTGIKKISAFTATATEDIRKDIVEQLGISEAEIFVRGFERDNLNLNVIGTKYKKETTAKLINNESIPAIIYTATRKAAEEACEFLRAQGIDSVYYHAGLTSELRRIIQDDFLSGRIKVIVSTNAFGMGIDKSDIRTVIHYNLPGNIENYYQEIGRAGRDGKDSNIFLLYDDKDIQIQEYFIRNSFPSKDQIGIVYDAVCDYGKVALGGLSKNEIPIDKNLLTFLTQKEINKALTESSLRLLEESGYLNSISEFNKKHEVRFLISPAKLNSFVNNLTDNELKDLVLILARDYGSKLFNTSSVININRISSQLNAESKEIITGLEQLASAGIIEYKKPSSYPSIILKKHRVKIEELILDYRKLNDLQKHSIQKLQQMISYTKTSSCRFKYILDYFGQDTKQYKCGKCDICRGVNNSDEYLYYITEHILDIFEQISKIKRKDLLEVLIGVSAKNDLSNLSTFGSCSHFKKDEIEKSISSLLKEDRIVTDAGYLKLKKIIDKEINSKDEAFQNYEKDLILFNLLRQVRKETAQKYGQTPSMICPDNILREIAAKKPMSFSEMMNIPGFNQRMFNKIGDDFICAIKDFSESNRLDMKLKEKNIPQNAIMVLELIQKKYSLEDISSLTKMPESVISLQVETLLELMPEMEVNFLFDNDELEAIYEKIESGINDLKTLKSVLDSSISYAKIRIALAKHKIS